MHTQDSFDLRREAIRVLHNRGHRRTRCRRTGGRTELQEKLPGVDNPLSRAERDVWRQFTTFAAAPTMRCAVKHARERHIYVRALCVAARMAWLYEIRLQSLADASLSMCVAYRTAGARAMSYGITGR